MVLFIIMLYSPKGVVKVGESACKNVQFYQTLFWPVSATISLFAIAAMILVVTCTAINIRLYRDKAQLLKRMRSQSPEMMVVGELNTNSEYYEEVDAYQVSTNTDIDTNENSAYSTVKNM